MNFSQFSRRRFVTTGLALASTFELERAARALGFATAAPVCKLAPEQVLGPYYVANELVRSAITEGKAGVPLALELLVLDSRSCKPLANAAVDLWQCDGMGLYSGYTANSPTDGPGGPGGPGGRPPGPPPGEDGSGRPPGPPPGDWKGGEPPAPKPTDKLTFLRGIQMTAPDGTVRFSTIFPGFYMGRTNHIHFKVRIGGHQGKADGHRTYLAGHTSHVGQMFFDETLTEELMKLEPYVSHSIHRTTLDEDDIYADHGSEVMAAITFNKPGDAAAGLHGKLIVAVDPTATAKPVGGPGGGPGGGPPPQRR